MTMGLDSGDEAKSTYHEVEVVVVAGDAAAVLSVILQIRACIHRRGTLRLT